MFQVLKCISANDSLYCWICLRTVGHKPMSRCTRYGNGAACVYSGSCTCGAITYTIKNGNASRQPPIRKVDICHCSQCKEESKTYKDERLLENPGAPWMAVPRAGLQFIFGSSLQKEHFCGKGILPRLRGPVVHTV